MDFTGNYGQRPMRPPITSQMGPPPFAPRQGPDQQMANPFGMQSKGRSPYAKMNPLASSSAPPLSRPPNSFATPLPNAFNPTSSAPTSGHFASPPGPQLFAPRMQTAGDAFSNQLHLRSYEASSQSWPNSPEGSITETQSPNSLPPTINQIPSRHPGDPFNYQFNKPFGHLNTPSTVENQYIDNVRSAFNQMSLDSPASHSVLKNPNAVSAQNDYDYEDAETDESDESSAEDESDDVESDDLSSSSDEAGLANQVESTVSDRKAGQAQMEQKTLLQQAGENVGNVASDGTEHRESKPNIFDSVQGQISNNLQSSFGNPPVNVAASFSSNEPFNLFANTAKEPSLSQSISSSSNYAKQQSGSLEANFEGGHNIYHQGHPSAFKAVKPSKINDQKGHQNFSSDSLENSSSTFGMRPLVHTDDISKIKNQNDGGVSNQPNIENESKMRSSVFRNFENLNDPARYTEDQPSLVLDPRSHETANTSASSEMNTSQTAPQLHRLRKDYPHSKELLHDKQSTCGSQGSLSSLGDHDVAYKPTKNFYEQPKKDGESSSSSDPSSGNSSKSVIERGSVLDNRSSLLPSSIPRDTAQGIEFNPQSESSPAHKANPPSDVLPNSETGSAVPVDNNFLEYASYGHQKPTHDIHNKNFNSQSAIQAPGFIQDSTINQTDFISSNPVGHGQINDQFAEDPQQRQPAPVDHSLDTHHPLRSGDISQQVETKSTSTAHPKRKVSNGNIIPQNDFGIKMFSAGGNEPRFDQVKHSSEEKHMLRESSKNEQFASDTSSIVTDTKPTGLNFQAQISDHTEPSSSQIAYERQMSDHQRPVNRENQFDSFATKHKDMPLDHKDVLHEQHTKDSVCTQQMYSNDHQGPSSHKEDQSQRTFSHGQDQLPKLESDRSLQQHDNKLQQNKIAGSYGPLPDQFKNALSFQETSQQQSHTTFQQIPPSHQEQPSQKQQEQSSQLQNDFQHQLRSQQQQPQQHIPRQLDESSQHHHNEFTQPSLSSQHQQQQQYLQKHSFDQVSSPLSLEHQPSTQQLQNFGQIQQQLQQQPANQQQQPNDQQPFGHQHKPHNQQQPSGQQQLSFNQPKQPDSQQQQQQQQPFSQHQQPFGQQQQHHQQQLIKQQQESVDQQEPRLDQQQQQMPSANQPQQPFGQQQQRLDQQQQPVSQQQQHVNQQMPSMSQTQQPFGQQQQRLEQQQQMPSTSQPQQPFGHQQQPLDQQQQPVSQHQQHFIQQQQPFSQQQQPFSQQQQPVGHQQQQPFNQQQQQFGQQQQPFGQQQQQFFQQQPPHGQQQHMFNQQQNFQHQQQQQPQQLGQQQFGPQYYSNQQQQGDVNQRYESTSPAFPMQQHFQGYQDPNQMQMWNPQYGNYMQNYNYDYYNWYFSNMANWGYPGYGYHGGYNAMNWDARSHHSDQMSYRSSTNSEVDVDSRPSSVIDNKPLDDYEIESLAMGKKEISTFENTSPVPIERLTPLHFYKPHLSARFTTAGSCIITNPNDPKDGQVPSVLCVPNKNLYAVTDFQDFPGPLIREDASKKKVIMFAKKRAKHWLASTEMKKEFCDSLALLWEYMAMLVKHNGVFDGPDVAELLMHHKTNGVGEKDEDMLGLHTAEETVKISKKVALQQYRDYLIQGSRKEALDFAMNHDLWGHALTLSYKMDHKLHQAVMSRLIASLEDEDSLVSLYGHLSGRGLPLQSSHAIKSGLADWREHLAMLIANPTKNKDKDNKNVLSLGDALRCQGNIGAAHLCYLLANVRLSAATDDTTRIWLLGVDHNTVDNISRPDLWAKNEFLQLSEIYEYALWLRSKESYIPSLQSMKLIYANRLSECGMLAEAHSYCESIARIILENTQGFYYEENFVLYFTKTFERLHYQSMESYDDPESELYTRIVELRDRERNESYKPERKQMEPFVKMAPSGSLENLARETPSQASQDQTEESRASSDLQMGMTGLQEDAYGEQQHYPVGHAEQIQNEGNLTEWQNENNSQWESQTDNRDVAHNWQQDQTDGAYSEQKANQMQYDGYNDSYQSQMEPQSQENMQFNENARYNEVYDERGVYEERYNSTQNETHAESSVAQHYQHTQSNYLQSNSNEQTGQFFNPTQFQEQNFMQQPTILGQSHQYQGDMAAGNNFEPNRSTQTINHAQEEEPEENLVLQMAQKKSKEEKSEGIAKTEKKKEEEESKKPAETKKRGLISSILSRLTGGAKEADLPDDKDNSIYYDKDLGKWVDSNASDESVAPPPPPPTDSKIMSDFKPKLGPNAFESLPAANTFPSPIMSRKPNASDSNLASSHDEGAASPTVPSKFSRTAHGLGRRGHRYVSSFGSINKSDVTDSPSFPAMFNPMGMTQQAPMNFFIPQSPDSAADAASGNADNQGNEAEQTSQNQQQPQQQQALRQQQQQQPQQQQQQRFVQQQQQPNQQQQQEQQQPPQQPAFFNPMNMPQSNNMQTPQRSRYRR